MKRFACLVVLMALSSPAVARDSYSFTVHGHRIHVEADRHCRSLSCVWISIPGVGSRHNRRDRDEDDVAAVRELPSASASPAPQSVLVQPQAQTAPAPAPVAPPPMARTVTVQAQPLPQPALIQAVPPAPVQAAPVAAPTLAAASPETKPVAATGSTPLSAVEPAHKPQNNPSLEAPAAAAQQAAHSTEIPAADSPLGDWKTDGKNPTLVHIESCGEALCGYVLDAATKTKGESILVNMKPKTDAEWSGNVYSRTSGNSYYGTMTLKQADLLRVEACAFARFLCSANNWKRVQPRPDEIMTSERATATPRS
jgi:uncharacterized protein (DUF2147 family)